MIDKSVTCCFTGHRHNKLPWGLNENDPRCLELKARISDSLEAVYASGIRHFICGMATGGDFYFCEAAVALRGCHGEITVEAAIPWEGQASRWIPPLKKRYYRLVSECDFTTLVQREYSPDCMMRRNRYMVDNSRILIAACSGSPGGTMNTMLYALRKGLEIIELYI